MDKVVRDGKVAILYSPGFGAGWYTWNYQYPECQYHPKLVALVENHASAKEIQALATMLFGEDFYADGAADLTIAWLPVGTSYQIREYDGSESIQVQSYSDWSIA